MTDSSSSSEESPVYCRINNIYNTSSFFARRYNIKKSDEKVCHLKYDVISKRNSLFDYTDPEAIKYLLSKNVNVKQIDNLKKTALFSQHHPESIKLLLDAGINVNQKDFIGNNALFYKDDLEILKLFINAGVDINAVNNNNENLLFHFFNLECVKLLVDFGININQVNNSGENAIFYRQKKSDNIKFLISKGININQIDNLGKCALQYQSSLENIKILLDAEIDFSSFKIENEEYELSYIKELLKYGYNINNISPNIHSSFLKENGHDFYLSCQKEFNLNEIFSKVSNWRTQFVNLLRSSVTYSLDYILSLKDLEMLSLLFYNKIYPEIEILNLGFFKLDTFDKIRLFCRLNDNGEIQNDTIDNKYQNLLNKILAPFFINQLFLHPVTQSNLVYKKKIDKDEFYNFYYKNSKKLFGYLSEEEILSLLKIDLDTLQRYRLRKNYLDNRSLQELLEEENISLSLWDLLFLISTTSP